MAEEAEQSTVQAEQSTTQASGKTEVAPQEQACNMNTNVLRNVKAYIDGFLENTTDIEMKRIITEAGGEVLYVLSLSVFLFPTFSSNPTYSLPPLALALLQVLRLKRHPHPHLTTTQRKQDTQIAHTEEDESSPACRQAGVGV